MVSRSFTYVSGFSGSILPNDWSTQPSGKPEVKHPPRTTGEVRAEW